MLWDCIAPSRLYSAKGQEPISRTLPKRLSLVPFMVLQVKSFSYFSVLQLAMRNCLDIPSDRHAHNLSNSAADFLHPLEEY